MTPSRIETDDDGTDSSRLTTPSSGYSSLSSLGSSMTSRSSSGGSTAHSSRLDSYLSPGTNSDSKLSRIFRRRPASDPSIRRRSRRLRSSSASSRASSRSSKGSQKSILKKKKKRGSLRRPIGDFKMIKDPVAKEHVRTFLSTYSSSASDFDAFSMSVDGVPFVAVSLMNAGPELCSKLLKPMAPIPPTPMRRHTPGINSPRKRRLSSSTASPIHSSKCVRFSDENRPVSSVSAGRKSRSSSAEEHRELTEKISEALVNNERQNQDLWHDRVEEKDRK